MPFFTVGRSEGEETRWIGRERESILRVKGMELFTSGEHAFGNDHRCPTWRQQGLAMDQHLLRPQGSFALDFVYKNRNPIGLLYRV
jgi:hypothetical protein